MAQDVSNEVNETARRRYGEIVRPNTFAAPEFFWLRVMAGLYFIVGSLSFIAGTARLVWKVYRRWGLGESSFFIPGATLVRTFGVAITGLLLMGFGAVLLAMRGYLRSRYLTRSWPTQPPARSVQEDTEDA